MNEQEQLAARIEPDQDLSASEAKDTSASPVVDETALRGSVEGQALAAKAVARGGPSLSILCQSLAILDAAALYFAAWLVLGFSQYDVGSSVGVAGGLYGLVPLALAVTYLGFAVSGLYRPSLVVRVSRQCVTLLAVWFFVGAATVLSSISLFDGPYSLMVAWLGIVPVCLLMLRISVAAAIRLALSNGQLSERVALLGAPSDCELVSQFLDADRLATPLMSIDLTGPKESIERSLEELDKSARAGELDSALVLVPGHAALNTTSETIHYLSSHAIRVSLLPIPVLQAWVGKDDFDLEQAAVVMTERPIRGWGRILKSCLDKAAAVAGLILFGPLMVLIAIAIKLDSPGPIFFEQRRHGLNGRVFKILKFRSMTVCEDGKYIKQAEKNDARVTRVGNFIRSTSFDELPQFINVLKGDMSVVGPRPHALAHDELYMPLIPTYRMRFRVKPGITGWAQINGLRGETKTLQEMADRIEYDVDYTRRWWIGLDVWILIKTLFVGFVSQRTY